MKVDDHTAKDIAKYLGVRRATVYRDLGDVAAYPPIWPLELINSGPSRRM